MEPMPAGRVGCRGVSHGKLQCGKQGVCLGVPRMPEGIFQKSKPKILWHWQWAALHRASPSHDVEGTARCRVVGVLCYSLHRNKEGCVYTQIFAHSKAISWKILKKLLTVVLLQKTFHYQELWNESRLYFITQDSPCSFSMLYCVNKIPIQNWK